MIIYLTTNLINAKIYVGKDCKNNPNYYGSGILIVLAIKKYGKDSFSKEILEVCDNNDWAEAERWWIKQLDSCNPLIGYNRAPGGEGWSSEDIMGDKNPNYGKHGKDHHWYGKTHPQEYKDKMSEMHSGENNPMYGRTGEKCPFFGKHHTEENKEIARQRRLGTKHSPETIEKIRLGCKNIPHPPGMPGKENPMYGRHHTEESKKKMTESKRLKKLQRLALIDSGNIKTDNIDSGLPNIL